MPWPNPSPIWKWVDPIDSAPPSTMLGLRCQSPPPAKPTALEENFCAPVGACVARHDIAAGQQGNPGIGPALQGGMAHARLLVADIGQVIEHRILERIEQGIADLGNVAAQFARHLLGVGRAAWRRRHCPDSGRPGAGVLPWAMPASTPAIALVWFRVEPLGSAGDSFDRLTVR